MTELSHFYEFLLSALLNFLLSSAVYINDHVFYSSFSVDLHI